VKSNRYEQKKLSRREEQVMRLLADGKTTPEIARRLGLSLKTIQGFIGRAKTKLRVENMTQLIRLAVIAYSSDATGDLRELLYCADRIEVRFFDRRRKLIATRQYSDSGQRMARVRKR
jgi:DNA-binding CsgD family transcriptional regulator